MPFSLKTAPIVFQHMANEIFRDFLDIFLIIYLGDILIYSKTQEEHDTFMFAKYYNDCGTMVFMLSWKSTLMIASKLCFWPISFQLMEFL